MEEITLSLPGKLAYLHAAAALAREVCLTVLDRTTDKNFGFAVELAVTEAYTNAVRYGGTGTVIVAFRIHPDRLDADVRDQGQGFDIGTVPDPDPDIHREGGYGIHLMKSLMTTVTSRREGRWNVLAMTKKFQ